MHTIAIPVVKSDTTAETQYVYIVEAMYVEPEAPSQFANKVVFSKNSKEMVE